MSSPHVELLLHLTVGSPPRLLCVCARSVENTRPIIRNGSAYIVNVPPGFYCKAFVNRTPILLGAGQHHINVAGFSIVGNADAAMVNVNDPYIRHGIIHIVRVSPNQKFKAMLHGQVCRLPLLLVFALVCFFSCMVARPLTCACQRRSMQPIILEARLEPYVFNEATFLPGGDTPASSFVAVTTKYICHHVVHEVRLDQGEVALCWLDNKPLILGSAAFFGRELAIDRYAFDIDSVDDDHRCYHIDSPTFRMVMTNGRPHILQIGEERVIRHGTVHVIRVRQVCRNRVAPRVVACALKCRCAAGVLSASS